MERWGGEGEAEGEGGCWVRAGEEGLEAEGNDGDDGEEEGEEAGEVEEGEEEVGGREGEEEGGDKGEEEEEGVEGESYGAQKASSSTVRRAMSHSTPMASTRATNLVSSPRRFTFTWTGCRVSRAMGNK